MNTDQLYTNFFGREHKHSVLYCVNEPQHVETLDLVWFCWRECKHISSRPFINLDRKPSLFSRKLVTFVCFINESIEGIWQKGLGFTESQSDFWSRRSGCKSWASECLWQRVSKRYKAPASGTRGIWLLQEGGSNQTTYTNIFQPSSSSVHSHLRPPLFTHRTEIHTHDLLRQPFK